MDKGMYERGNYDGRKKSDHRVYRYVRAAVIVLPEDREKRKNDRDRKCRRAEKSHKNIADPIAEISKRMLAPPSLLTQHVARIAEKIGNKANHQKQCKDSKDIRNQLISKRGLVIVLFSAFTLISLRKIVKGPTDDSYGIEVAKLAGVPNEVVKRAKAVLNDMVEHGFVEAKPSKKAEMLMNATMSFEDMSIYEAADKIKKVDINTLTPIEAMNFIFELKKMLG
jgi:DNA mismatch repair ATPase MutS